MHIEVDSGDSRERSKHRKRKEDEEQVDTFGLLAKAKCVAHRLRLVAGLDHEHARIHEDEGELNQHHQRTVCRALQRLNRQVKRKERHADEKSNEHPSLHCPLDQKNPAGQRQLAAHLDGLPPEDLDFVVARQECGCTTQSRRSAVEEGLAACPEKQRVQQGHANRPHEQRRECHTQSQRVIIGIAIQRQIVPQISPALDLGVHHSLAQECLEDPRRRTRHEDKCYD
mmetsp:Transcript_61058/g.181845  ORF Transcript_61058/g.181845 Transcript_61058/m.181845 type:complete len:227 (-) Transcript_61058:880-1560(-)